MDSLAGQQLVKADGTSVNADEALADKELVLYYFSAHWCPPCRQFTPMLKDFYEEVSDEGVEIVFVSSDRSKEDMLSYMKESHGDWLATEHNSNLTNSLKQKYGVSGIPTLVVCKKDGTVITKDGRGHVMSKQPAQAVKDWKS
ncbi:nucleoredoxin-like protein 2 isoform X1 [Eurytemora carolleeae]|uniref:nucleoredoxin-like protein 2 isoform X1 n=1 Tax=Eurytemora carolleeae TaxID=1294199 RepID=UPI000C756D86|nr:nucleoredoxin-like protein 2 isoform X1 [Eurytemora carolleeae]|eukprot:XP_023340804.1 nucleoredoxin-like protein 2 isoform X1 [Eurytemora affinis]